jgi:hypothetical protein
MQMLNLSEGDPDDSARAKDASFVAYRITEVLIVDDGSSREDRRAMMEVTENCTTCVLVFKGEATALVANPCNLTLTHRDFSPLCSGDCRAARERARAEHEHDLSVGVQPVLVVHRGRLAAAAPPGDAQVFPDPSAGDQKE